MQVDLFQEFTDFSDKKVLIGLLGGINSMAVLCQLADYPSRLKPKELHLFYVHFKEHSEDTMKFVHAGVRYARKHFNNVKYFFTKNSINDYFRKKNFIPHPRISPCSKELKIIPITTHTHTHTIDFDLIGYVREEKRRMERQINLGAVNKVYLIAELTNEECFDIVKEQIGWYPKIYDIRENGKRVFKHNNCLPCKNMSEKDLQNVGKYFPKLASIANDTAKQIGKYWGREDSEIKIDCKVCEW